MYIPNVDLRNALTCTGNIFLQKIHGYIDEKNLKGSTGVISVA